MEVFAKITTERVHRFYWQKLMCSFGLLELSSLKMELNFPVLWSLNFENLRVETKFVSVVHLQGNGKAELANKIILNGLKKKLDGTKGL